MISLIYSFDLFQRSIPLSEIRILFRRGAMRKKDDSYNVNNIGLESVIARSEDRIYSIGIKSYIYLSSYLFMY